MNDAVKRYIEAAAGFGNLTKQHAERIAKQLVRQGEAASDQVGDVVEDLLDRQRRNREAITDMVRAETRRAVRLMGLATTDQVEHLQAEIADLRRQVEQAEEDAGTTDGHKSTSKRAKAKTAAAKKPPRQKPTEKASS